ncbi:methyl-accepting chemotaxis protein [Psychrosphaera ytuae]|uniref:Methyl-accepting chemotaxis protein n=1 Tax=Psychrosphaera ytuae TaxID=2820710 RepID=A0A975DC61_9GAMM|nr:methyl-accepting chemotaxis protein [Psychrosphaera ytuae]QTH64249.1 methyl-accepting chemotaxis protein [Psychrosphaera ytuae]
MQKAVRRSISIQLKLIIALIAAVVISTSIVSYIGYSKAQSIMVSRIEQSELPNLLQRVRNAIDGQTARMSALTKSIATNPMILDWVENGNNQDAKLLTEYLNNIKTNNGYSNASFANRKTAEYWNHDGFLRVLRQNQEDGWFYAFRDSGVAESASIYTYPNGKTDIFVNYQNLNGKGAAGVAKSFDDMIDYLAGFKIEQTGFVYLVNGEGQIQVHPDKEKVGKLSLNQEYKDLDASTLLARQDFAFQQTEDYVVAASYIPSMKWYVVSQVPTAELYAGLVESRNHMIFWFIIVVGILAGVSVYMSGLLVKPIKELAKVFQDLGKGEGDLTIQIHHDARDELGVVVGGFNKFISKLQSVMIDVANTSIDLRQAAEIVSSSAKSSSKAAELERDQSIHAATAVNQMGITIGDIAKSANIAAEATQTANEKVNIAHNVVTDSSNYIGEMASGMETVSNTIESLAEKSVSISGVLDVIRGVSEQTNLLALNAAIEAARAGEQGRGFAVVADEVRNLAKRTNESTDEIAAMITLLQTESETAVAGVQHNKDLAARSADAATKANDALKDIVEQIHTLEDLNTQVATATEEQLTVVQEINGHVKQISENSEKAAANSTNMADSSEDLKLLAKQLDDLVNSFKVR